MRRKDLLWVFAYPIYQVIGTLRHEAGHALAALASGGVVEEFVFLPTKGYWGYVRWQGPHSLFTLAAPYLLDLFTFLVFFTLCMQLAFRRRWIWLNLVILGVISPLVNSAYNYWPNPGRANDVSLLLRDGNELMVHAYFILTLSLYAAGLYILFTRARAIHRQPPARRAWTVPLVLGSALLLSACAASVLPSAAPEAQQPIGTSTEAPRPTPRIRSATMTPTAEPARVYFELYEQVVAMLNTEFPGRSPGEGLAWSRDIKFLERDLGSLQVDANFVSGEWHIRLFDWNFEDPLDAVDVSVWNDRTHFIWKGFAVDGELQGWLTSGGLVPQAGESAAADGWFTYTNQRYGYRFQYPPAAQIFESGVEMFDLNEIPAGMTEDEYRVYLYETVGANICVKLVLGNGYILFEAPENWGANYTFCRRQGPGAAGWSTPERQEVVEVDGQLLTFTGHELIKVDGTGDTHDEALALKLPSGVRIEFGAYSDALGGYARYRAEVLPVLLRILESYETIPRSSTP